MSLFSRLKQNHNLTPAEQHLVDYIVINSNEVMEMSMTQLAKATFISRSTIARFCEKNGFSGYHDFKTQLAIEMNLFLKENSDSLAFPITSSDKTRDIIDKMTSNSIYSLMETSKVNGPDILEKIVSQMKAARRVIFHGANFSHLVARDAAMRFMKLGLPVISAASQTEMLIQARYAGSEDLAILLSYSGHTKSMLKTAELLKKRGVPCVSITANAANPLTELCDYHLYINATDSMADNLATASRLAMLHVIDILYMVYVRSDIEGYLARLKSTDVND